MVGLGCRSDRDSCSSWNPFRQRQQVCYPVVDAPVVDDCFTCAPVCSTGCATTMPGSCATCTTGVPTTGTTVIEPAPL
ncbi:MAG: hypothetical protein Q4D62_00540 [Planctomycetia bacterium]|nr:hypothetical protein [Planctomycetia bacterium]